MLARSFIVTAMLLLSWPGHSYAQEFSADTVSMVNGVEIIGKFYYKPDRWRMAFEANGIHQATIFRKDKKVVWQFDSAGKQYVEYFLEDKEIVAFVKGEIEGEYKRELLGKEKVRERNALKYKVFYVDRKRNYLFQWIDEELKLPIKATDKNGQLITEYRNMKIEPQAAELFELPNGYTKEISRENKQKLH